MEAFWMLLVLSPLLVVLGLLGAALKRLRSRWRDVPSPGAGDEGDDGSWTREPRRPLRPAGSASVANPIPEDGRSLVEAIGHSRPDDPDAPVAVNI